MTNNFTEKIKSLSTHLSDSPNTIFRYYRYDFNTLRTKRKLKLNEKILIGVLHWYFPIELRFIFNLWLEESWGADHKEIKEVILISKEMALGYLLVQDRWNNHDFFGNILCKSQSGLLDLFNFKLTKNTEKVPKYTGYCRGYRESGKRTLHQPEKAIVKKLLTVEEIWEREQEEQRKFDDLLYQIEEHLSRINNF